MRPQTFAKEAVKCRKLAGRYSGGAEQRLLLNVAAAFDELAVEAKSIRRPALGPLWAESGRKPHRFLKALYDKR